MTAAAANTAPPHACGWRGKTAFCPLLERRRPRHAVNFLGIMMGPLRRGPQHDALHDRARALRAVILIGTGAERAPAARPTAPCPSGAAPRDTATGDGAGARAPALRQ